MKTVIMAGGKGTRISSVDSAVPKPMLSIAGKPVLEHQLECLCRQGYKEIIITTGHLGHLISEYFGDGSKFGAHINYIEEKEPLGTAGALYYLKDEIKDDFLLINGDVIFDVDINRFYSHHKKHGGIATLFTHPNNHPYDSGIIVSDNNGRVEHWLHKEDERGWYKNRVNAGLHMLSPKVFEYLSGLKKTDMDRDILKPMVKQSEVYSYDSPEYVKDIGTPERFYAVESDIKSGKVQRKNLTIKQKAVFFDRDGTINKHIGFLTGIDDFELLDGVAEIVRHVNQSGLLAIIITNQPVIARGEISWEDLGKIHDKMETLLGRQGAFIDDIFICPHHPHSGFQGERPEYKIECECRKPKPGLIFEAAAKYNINLAQSYMIGDSERDMEAGRRAGCKTILAPDGFRDLDL